MMACPVFKQNEDATDRISRVIAGFIMLGVGFLWLTGIMQAIAIILGVLMLLTGAMGFCALYALFGFSTYKSKKETN